MRTLLRFSNLLIVTVAVTSVNAYAARFHDDIYRAVNVFVCEAAHDGCQQSTSDSILKIFAAKNRWTLVSKPEKADLILVWFNNSYTSSSALGRVGITNTWRFGGLIVLKGGTTPDWNSVPLYITGGKYVGSVIEEFYNEVIQTAPILTPSGVLKSRHIVRWGRSVEEHTEILADEPSNATAYYARGAAYYDKGEYDNAIKDFNMALSLKPDFDEARTRLETAKKMKAAVDCHFQIPCPK
ncbi:MAG TPA: tetratricopeptide repeat protein [Candidatus Acidoferrales bacterium]|nr:tetratricopeptide repeat protein [Candidatus Acidoferrales bacterium]